MKKNFAARRSAKSDQDGPRWELYDPNTNKVLDDAQGFGYHSKNKAMRAGWYKFGGGKEKIDTAERESWSFWRRYPEYAKDIQDAFGCWFKEISRGEIDMGEYAREEAEKRGITDFNIRFLEHLPEEPISAFKGKLL